MSFFPMIFHRKAFFQWALYTDYGDILMASRSSALPTLSRDINLYEINPNVWSEDKL